MAKVKNKAKTNKKSSKTFKRGVSKKVAKKKISNKTIPKRKIKVKIFKKTLGEAPEECCFILNGGKKLKSVQELTEALETMSEDIFNHHVNNDKNDFATWIKDIFQEDELADELRKANSKIETRIKLLQRLVNEAVKEGKQK